MMILVQIWKPVDVDFVCVGDVVVDAAAMLLLFLEVDRQGGRA